MSKITFQRKILYSGSYKVTLPNPIVKVLNITNRDFLLVRVENRKLIVKKSKAKRRKKLEHLKQIPRLSGVWRVPVIDQKTSLRFSIPRKLIQKLGWDENTYVNIWLENGEIHIEKYENPPEEWLIKKRGIKIGYTRK